MSIAQRLYRDCLQSVFSLLTLRELAAAARVCVDWRSGVYGFPLVGGFHLDLEPANEGLEERWGREHFAAWALNALALSPLRKLVGSLRISQTTRLLIWDLPLLAPLTHLHSLDCCLRLEGRMHVADLHFPESVRNLRLDCRQAALHYGELLLRALGRSPSITSLVLLGSGTLSAQHSSLDEQIIKLTSLRHFETDLECSPMLCAALKSMSQLRSLRFLHRDHTSGEVITLLATPPCALSELTHLELWVRYLTAEQIKALAAFPALRSGMLNATPIAIGALPSLQRLPKTLRALVLIRADQGRIPEEADEKGDNFGLMTFDGEALVNHLLPCSFLGGLRKFSLTRASGLTAELTDALFSRMGQLISLTLVDVNVPSLSFLRHTPLLECLDLDFEGSAHSLSAADLQSIVTPPLLLPRLRCLFIAEKSHQLVSVESLAILASKASSLKLAAFSYRRRGNPRLRVFWPSQEDCVAARALEALNSIL